MPVDITVLTTRVSVGGGIFHKANAHEIAKMGITHVIDMQGEYDDGPLFEGTQVKVLWVPFHDVMQPPSKDLMLYIKTFIINALEQKDSRIHAHCFLPGMVVGAKTPFLIEDPSALNVITHLGNTKNINIRSVCEYKGPAFELTTSSGLPIKCTPEHPFYIVRPYRRPNGKIVKPYRIVNGKVDGPHNKFEPFWCNAEDLQKGDYLLTPKIKLDEETAPKWIESTHPNTKKINDFYLDEDVAWFLGVFIANGSTTKYDCSVCIKESGDFMRAVKVIESFDVGCRVDVRDHCYVIKWQSVTMSQSFVSWIGKGPHHKKIPEFLFGKYLPSVIEGIVDGGGTVDKRRTTGRKFVTTVSQTLAHQLWYALVATDRRPTMTPYERETNLDCDRSPTWGISWIESDKIQYNFFHEGYYCLTLDDIVQFDYEGKVYNFDIEDDHSYLVNGICTHNCAAGVHRGSMAALLTLCLSGISIENAEDIVLSHRLIASFPKVYFDAVKEAIK